MAKTNKAVAKVVKKTAKAKKVPHLKLVKATAPKAEAKRTGGKHKPHGVFLEPAQVKALNAYVTKVGEAEACKTLGTQVPSLRRAQQGLNILQSSVERFTKLPKK